MNFREEIQNMLRLTERMTPIESNRTIFAIATTINTFSSRIYLIFLPTKRTYILMLKKLRKKNPKKYQEIIDELNKEKNV